MFKNRNGHSTYIVYHNSIEEIDFNNKQKYESSNVTPEKTGAKHNQQEYILINGDTSQRTNMNVEQIV